MIDGSNGLNGAISSTKNEQKKIINNIEVDIIAVGDFIKAKIYITIFNSYLCMISIDYPLALLRLHSNSWINKIIKNIYNKIYHYKYKSNKN